MDVTSLWTLQIMMFVFMFAGAILRKTNVLGENSRAVITDLVMGFILPCNIIVSFRMDFDFQILHKMITILLISVGVQAVSYLFSKTLYNRYPDGMKRVFQYGTIVSNSGFLGLPIVEQIYGLEGLMYASIFLIPLRIMMWSCGVSCFSSDGGDIKSALKKVAKHPCMVAVYIGLGLMILGGPLGNMYNGIVNADIPGISPLVIMLGGALDKMVRNAGGCTTTLTMVLIGTMLVEIKPAELFTKATVYACIIREGVLPGLCLIACILLKIPALITSVAVVLTAMPLGTTTAVLAAKYNCDYRFGTKLVVFSTLVSMVTIPLWCMLLSSVLG